MRGKRGLKANVEKNDQSRVGVNSRKVGNSMIRIRVRIRITIIVIITIIIIIIMHR